MSLDRRRRWRLFVGICVPLGIALFACLILLTGKTPPCIFHELTGLHCFGCGSGRALLALLRLDLYAAFRFNPLFILFLPFLSYYLLKVYVGFVFGWDLLPFPKRIGFGVGVAVLVTVLAFGVLRNLPFFPFTLLAPTAV